MSNLTDALKSVLEQARDDFAESDHLAHVLDRVFLDDQTPEEIGLMIMDYRDLYIHQETQRTIDKVAGIKERMLFGVDPDDVA